MNLKNITLLIILTITSLNCEENFSPYDNYQLKYSLNGIIRADTNLQAVTIFKTAEPQQNLVNSNLNDYFVHNAKILLWNGVNKIYFLRDTTIEGNEENSIKNYYYAKFNIQEGDTLEIEALLPDGNRLRSKTIVPEVQLEFNRSSHVIPDSKGGDVVFEWKSNENNLIYIPVFSLIYYVDTGTKLTLKKVTIPWGFVKENGKTIGINKPPTKIPKVVYDLDNVKSVLRNIAKNEPKNSQILISGAILHLRIFDKNLSTYYLSTSRLFDEYTISLDVRDFGNISGGLGIFGSFIEQRFSLLFTDKFLRQFGYKNY